MGAAKSIASVVTQQVKMTTNMEKISPEENACDAVSCGISEDYPSSMTDPKISIDRFNEDSDSGIGSRIMDDGDDDDKSVETSNLLSADIEREEQELAQKSAEEEERLWQEMQEKYEKEEKEERFKRLLQLLSRSQFYTNFLLSKIETQKQAKENQKTSDKTEETGDEGDSQKENKQKTKTTSPSSPVKKRKLSDSNSNVPKMLKLDDGSKVEKSSPVTGERLTDCGVLVPKRQPLLLEGAAMRPYQLEGLQWLQVLYENGVNGILADEMGLGKTIQCIALICHLIQMNVVGPFLIIAPLSTLPNWIIEFEKFAPKIPVLMYHGSLPKRNLLKRDVCSKKPVMGKLIRPIVITSYEIVMCDRNFLSKHRWRYIIVDEGHRLKNKNCRLVKELKHYHSVNRLLLTGTPLQNNLSELWSLLNFLLPEIFDDLNVFESWFEIRDLQAAEGSGKIIEQEQQQKVLATLHQILTPFLLRRVKTDVDLQIPPKKEVLVYAPLSDLQETLYRATVDRSVQKLLGLEEEVKPVDVDEPRQKRICAATQGFYKKLFSSKEGDNLEKWVQLSEEQQENVRKKRTEQQPEEYIINLKMRNVTMQLRKIVNHPYLVQFPKDPRTDSVLIDESLIEKAGKLRVLDALLPALKKRGHKVLLFSQMTSLLDIIEEYLLMRSHKYVRLDGSYGIEERQENIKIFNSDPSYFIFLISTRAGGLGINLTAADTVIIYDSDWNPQADLQAQDRCHRIGQTRPVVVYRLVTSHTIEERIVERATAKRKLEKMVIHQDKFKLGRSNLHHTVAGVPLPELLELLNSKEHDKVVRADKAVFTKEELDLLLDRSDLLSSSSQSESCGKVSGVFKVLKVDAGGKID